MEYEIETVEIKQSTQPQIERLKTWNQELNKGGKVKWITETHTCRTFPMFIIMI